MISSDERQRRTACVAASCDSAHNGKRPLDVGGAPDPGGIPRKGLSMANQEQLGYLKQDVDEWNTWREKNRDVATDLSNADLAFLDLRMANLNSSILTKANLVMANLSGADLRDADLSGANLVGARLIGVDFEGANLKGADLRTAEDLTVEQLGETLGDADTTLPEGVPRPENWSD